MLYSNLKAALPQNFITATKEIELNENLVLQVRQYVPTEEKAKIVQYVVNMSLDDRTGCFSPIRVNVYYAIAMLQHYCGIDFEDENLVDAYDQLDSCGFITSVLDNIPEEERRYMENLVNDTIEDIAKYNTSFAGTIQAATSEANNLDSSVTDILNKIKNKEGLEVLDEIKNVVGTD